MSRRAQLADFPRAAQSASAVRCGSQAAVSRSTRALVPLLRYLTGIGASQSTMWRPTVDAAIGMGAIEIGADRAAGDQWRRCGDATATGQFGAQPSGAGDGGGCPDCAGDVQKGTSGCDCDAAGCVVPARWA
jgi:hypothetical protein